MSEWHLTADRDDEVKGRYRHVPMPLLSRRRAQQNTSAGPCRHFDHYVAPEEAVAAVNTALQLGKPLLVAGEPGVGKTELAMWCAERLGLFDGAEPELLRFDVKSTSKGSDLIYRYDAISHFREAAAGQRTEDYIELEPLGQAIALACEPDDLPQNSGLRSLVKDYLEDKEQPRLSVVLIDEIDKAPRDVPNDLLRALDEMAFRIDELGPDAVIRCTSLRRPFVIVTTNDERSLPDAFLRRCCYLHIEFPAREQLEKIVRLRLGLDWAKGSLANDAFNLVEALRNPHKPRKAPGTAELIDFLLMLHAEGLDPDSRLTASTKRLAGVVFGKDKRDHEPIAKAYAHLGINGDA